MGTEDTTDTPPAASQQPQRSRARRALRAFAWGMTGLVALVLLLGAGAWWWLGSDQSLAFTLARAARYLPAGQTLESRDVSGSLRAGGRIGWLRWESESLSVEVRDARIGWQLAPLLRRRVQLGEVHAAQLLIEHRASAESKPVEPLQQLVLPVDIELPFTIDDLRWAGPPALQATHLAGSYRYSDAHHQLEITAVDIADGHYGAQLRLQGPAPMAIDATLNGRVRALLAEDHSLDVRAEASIKGTLAGPDARLAVAAELHPVDTSADPPMQAQLQANLAPWQAQPVIDAKAELQNIDLSALWPEAPATLLSGEIDAGPDATATAGEQLWQASAQVRNALPGPWDETKLPIEQLDARARFDGSTWTLPQLSVRAGDGRIDSEGSWSPAPAPWQVNATVRGVRPGALHTRLDGAPVSGRIQAGQTGDALQFDVALQAEGGAGGTGELQGLRLERALAKGQWQDQVLDLRSLRIEALRASLEGRLQVRVDDQAASGRLNLVVPGATALVDGRIAPNAGGGEVQARVEDAATLQGWLESLPELGALFGGTTLQGSARLDANWKGGWQAVQRRLQTVNEPAPRGTTEPTLQATLTIPKLTLKLPPSETEAPANPILLNGVRADLSGSLAQATLALKGEAVAGGRKITLDTRASGGLERRDQWSATLASLRLQALDTTHPDTAPWVLELGSPVSAKVRTVSGDNPRLDIEASAAAATLKGPAPGTVKIEWQPLRFSRTGTEARRAFRLQSKGRLQGLPMAWAELFGNGQTLAQVGFSGDLMFNGDWDIDAGDKLRAKARLMRESGDLRVQAGEAALVTRIQSRGTGTASERTMDAAGPGASTPAGLKRAEFALDAEGDTVRANLAWDSERAGEIRVEASTRVQQRQGGWLWADDAPLAGRVTARMPNLGVWSMLAPPGWRMAGTLEADATLAGKRDDPRWNGTLAADQLALRALVEGLDLRDGRLRAKLAGNRVEITEFTLKGGAGAQTRIPGQSGNLSTAASEAARDGGTLTARGELAWGAAPAAGAGSGIRMSMQAELRTLRVLVRADRQVTLSGNLQAKLAGGQFTVRGDIKTDRAVIILPDQTAPGLGSDIVIRSAAIDREAAEESKRRAAEDQSEIARAETAKPPDIVVSFDLGSDFAVQGRGITTRLAGKLDIRSTALNAPPRIIGEVRTVAGQYRAYGQALTIETGIARFNGPFDNPQLDILAIRPNISQRAGVAITGTAQSPRVRLYSEPALSDQETLTWLVLGRASATSGGESVLLQQAALALLGGLGGGGGSGLASRFGLDEIGFKGPGSGGDVRDSTVTVGKRIARDFYVTYERGLGGTLGTLFIFYDLTRRLTLRAQAGQQSAVDLIYTLQFD